MKASARLVGLALGTALAAACGGGNPTSTTTPTIPPPIVPQPPPPPPPTSTKVTIVDFEFTPDAITVPLGQTVVWTNTGSNTHTVVSGTNVFDSGDISPPNAQMGIAGGSFQFTFTTPGTYAYHCRIHPQMTGTITVNSH